MEENESKIKSDPTLLHALPFSAKMKRTAGYKKVSKWGNITVTLESLETVNAFDLITLLQLLKIYIQKTGVFRTITKEGSSETILKGTLKLPNLVKERELINDVNNQKVLLESLMRWKDVSYIVETPKRKTKSSFIYEVQFDKDKNEVSLIINKSFFDFCISKNALVIDFKQVLQYKSPRTILLDLFIQSTKWSQYPEDLLYEKTGLNDTDMKSWDKRDALRKCFHDIKLHANLDFTYENGYWTNYTQICDS